MGAACDYLMGLGMDKVEKYEHELSKYLYEVRRKDGRCVWGVWGIRTGQRTPPPPPTNH